MKACAIIHNDVSQAQVHPPGEHASLLVLGKYYGSIYGHGPDDRYLTRRNSGRECHLNTKTDTMLGGLYLSLTVTKASAVPGRGKMFLSLSKVKADT